MQALPRYRHIVDVGLAEYGQGPDAVVDGRRAEVWGVIWEGLLQGYLELVAIYEEDSRGSVTGQLPDPARPDGETPQDSTLVGFDVVSRLKNQLQGHVLYLLPEHRHRGLLRRYFDAALDLARERGLTAMSFVTQNPAWVGRAEHCGFRCGWSSEQEGHVTLRAYFRET